MGKITPYERKALSLSCPLWGTLTCFHHCPPSKKVADVKSKHKITWGDKKRTQKAQEAWSLKTDNWAAFKQLYVSSGSQKSQKEMSGSCPSGLLKKHPGQIVPSSPGLLVLFFLSPCFSHHLFLFFMGGYLSWLHQGSIINSHLGGPGAGCGYNGLLVQWLLFQWKTTLPGLRAGPRPHEGIPFIW